MPLILTTWRPKKRNIVFAEKPDWIPDWVYTEALTAKRNYNENWEFWVFNVSKDYNCSQAIAEDACIRGLKKAILQFKVAYGDQIGDWFEQFLDMGDIFEKVKHPIYLPILK